MTFECMHLSRQLVRLGNYVILLIPAYDLQLMSNVRFQLQANQNRDLDLLLWGVLQKV